MPDKKKNQSETELDLLAELLLERAKNKNELEKELEKLKLEILTEAQIVARWNKKSFYIC